MSGSIKINRDQWDQSFFCAVGGTACTPRAQIHNRTKANNFVLIPYMQQLTQCDTYKKDDDETIYTTVDGRKFATTTTCMMCARHATNNASAISDSNPLPLSTMLQRARCSRRCVIYVFRKTPPAVTTFLHTTLNFGARGVRMSMWMCLLCMCGCCELSSVNSPVITRQRLALDASLLAPTAPSNLEINT